MDALLLHCVMRNNQPVTQHEFTFADSELLLSTTDSQGRLTHCNAAFARVSGFTVQELMGQPHNIVRHPDMPPEAFKDMWATIGHGRSWKGLVKNRRKDGRFYWVHAHVTPIMQGDKPVGYMSVRAKPSREQVQAAEQLYAQLAQERGKTRPTMRLHAGHLRVFGWRNVLGKLQRACLTTRIAAAMAPLLLLGCLPVLLGFTAPWHIALHLLAMTLCAITGLAWLHRSITLPLGRAHQLAQQLASCQLNTALPPVHGRGPIARMTEHLHQVHYNLRAVVGDARHEISAFTQLAQELSESARNLALRTETQAERLQQTANAMTSLASNVSQAQHTTDTVLQQSHHSTQLTQNGGQAMQQVHAMVQELRDSSQQMGDIITAMEGIAFQTNILALNAAVEAARAGEQGRGFAVVAGEVRSLAQRSAASAKEVKTLISGSNTRIHAGAERMQQANGTLAQAVDAVAQVSALMQSLAQASRQQANGLTQVHSAVADIDQLTQENARMFERSVHSANGISSNAGTLHRTLEVFRM